MSDSINIIGGGLSGSLLAIYLAKRGFQINLFERRPDMRKNKISAGRSINLALSTRGLHALEKVGLDKDILSDAIPMYGRMMHFQNSDTAFQPYGKAGQAINSVSRGRLNIRLLELADEFENITLHFNTKCIDIDSDHAIATFEMEDGTKQQFQADRIIGTDGAFAATRGKLQTSDRFSYSQSYLPVGYKELAIPAGMAGAFQIEKNALHIWPRGAFMMIALPNPAGDFTCTLFLPFEGEQSFENLKSEESVEAFFKHWFPDAVPMMPSLMEDFFGNPTSSLMTIRCFPWVKKDKLALLGDAAHAVVPFYGQGMNCSFEDVVVLDNCIDQFGSDWTKIFDAYQKERKPNADAISELAIQNYSEMADKVGDKHFLHKKKLEHNLADLYPEQFKSQYELTTFSLSPYEYALKQGIKNDLLLERIISDMKEDQIQDQAYMATLWHLLN